MLLGGAMAVAAVLFVGALAVGRLEAHVDDLALRDLKPAVEFVDLPAELTSLAESDLRMVVADLLDRPWTDDQLCEEMASRLNGVGWIDQIDRVRRGADARFRVRARYRRPIGMVQQDDSFYLVDTAGTRLPGVYRYDSSWLIVQGVSRAAPGPGERWDGDDLRAGIDMIRLFNARAFDGQITGILVGNVGGRENPRGSHVELATDRAGGRIRWGSAPGRELEENSLERKLAILQDNFRRFGRVDAGHPVIDISTFPDRFTIPG